MCAPKSNAYRFWKGLFLTAEGFALLGFLYVMIGALCYRYYSRNRLPWGSDYLSTRLLSWGEQWMRPMFFSFATALLVLLIVSPFFMWSTLRRTAVKAWIIGALALLCAGYFVSWF